MKIVSFLLLFLYPTFVLAESNSNLFLKKNLPAPYDGYLINELTAQKLYKINFDYSVLEKKYTINEEIISNKSDQIDELYKDNQQMAKSIAEIEERNKKNLIITVGVTVAGCAVLALLVGLTVQSLQGVFKSPTANPSSTNTAALVRF